MIRCGAEPQAAFQGYPPTSAIVSRGTRVISDQGGRLRRVAHPSISAYSSFELKNLMITSKQSLDSGTSGL